MEKALIPTEIEMSADAVTRGKNKYYTLSHLTNLYQRQKQITFYPVVHCDWNFFRSAIDGLLGIYRLLPSHGASCSDGVDLCFPRQRLVRIDVNGNGLNDDLYKNIAQIAVSGSSCHTPECCV